MDFSISNSLRWCTASCRALLQLALGHFLINGAHDTLLYRMKALDFPLRLLRPCSGTTGAEAAAFLASLRRSGDKAGCASGISGF